MSSASCFLQKLGFAVTCSGYRDNLRAMYSNLSDGRKRSTIGTCKRHKKELKGNCNGFLLFAFLSSPRSISKCGKIQNFWSSILCAVARVFTVLPAVGGTYYDANTSRGPWWLLLYSVGFGQLEGKLRWEGCQGVSIDLFISEALEFTSSRFLSGVHSSATTEHSSIDLNSKCSSLHTVLALSIIQLTVLQQSDCSKEIISLLFQTVKVLKCLKPWFWIYELLKTGTRMSGNA